MFPKGWKVVALGDITAGQRIGTTRRGMNGGASLPLLKMGNVLWGGLDLAEIEPVDEAYALADGAMLEAGDILFNTRNTPELVGKTAFWPAPFDAAFDNNLMRIRLNSTADSRMVAAWMGSPIGQSAIGRFVCASTSVGAVYWRDLAKLEIPLPPFNEQRRIAAVLDAWDDAIGTAERLLDLRSRQIAGIGERLFRAGFEPEPPSGWLRVRLADAFIERDERGGGGRLLSVTAEQGIVDREEVGRKDTSTEDKSAYKRIYPGDIGYNTMRMWQGVSALSRLEGLISPAYTVVTPCKHINGQFAAQLFKQPRMIDRFWRYSQGLVDDTLNLKFPHFSQIIVNLPSIQYQQESAALLKNLTEAVGEERRKMALLRRQKRGLMQKLLTGEWRVPVTGDIFVPGGPTADRLEAAE